MRAWFSGRTPACQVGDGISIIPARTTKNVTSKRLLQVCKTLWILWIKDIGHFGKSVK